MRFNFPSKFLKIKKASLNLSSNPCTETWTTPEIKPSKIEILGTAAYPRHFSIFTLLCNDSPPPPPPSVGGKQRETNVSGREGGAGGEGRRDRQDNEAPNSLSLSLSFSPLIRRRDVEGIGKENHRRERNRGRRGETPWTILHGLTPSAIVLHCRSTQYLTRVFQERATITVLTGQGCARIGSPVFSTRASLIGGTPVRLTLREIVCLNLSFRRGFHSSSSWLYSNNLHTASSNVQLVYPPISFREGGGERERESRRFVVFRYSILRQRVLS